MIPAMDDRWPRKFERHLSFIAIPGLAAFIAGMHAIVGLLTQFKPEMPDQLRLVPELILHGQVWRCFTFILIPPDYGPLGLFIWVLMIYAYLVRLEAYWGDFQFTFFCLIGTLATSAASLATGYTLPATPFHMSLFLAFARLNPEFEVLFFFFLPAKMKWLAGAFWFIILWDMIFGSAGDRIALLAGLANYFLFFGSSHWLELKNLWRRSRYQGRF
jgi:hypothetical protein